MEIKAPKGEVGVIVARFQTDELTEGHKQLVNFVLSKHNKVIVFLGLSPLCGTTNNPLDFQARKQMLEEGFPSIIVAYIKDVNNDLAWSKNLDGQIEDLAKNQSVVLYGSRDSFAEHYKGRFPVTELEASLNISGTEIRRKIKTCTRPSREFRAGVIWSAYNRYDTVYSTVDVAIMKGEETLLARKPYEKLWRFVGGFADPSCGSDEEDAIREVAEETHLEITDLEYICSVKTKDWRYKNERDSIRTRFFKANYVFGRPTPDDDIEELKWFTVKSLEEDPTQIVENHRILLEKLIKNIQR